MGRGYSGGTAETITQQQNDYIEETYYDIAFSD